MDREVMRIRDSMAIKYAELVYNGYWYSPEKEFIQAAMDKAQEPVTGSVNVQLYKGNTIMRGRSSPFSLYNEVGGWHIIRESGTAYKYAYHQSRIPLMVNRSQQSAPIVGAGKHGRRRWLQS
eukprot:SAG11_NODE_5068_length_1674_cov_1.685714_2_plen_122_part_00